MITVCVLDPESVNVHVQLIRADGTPINKLYKRNKHVFCNLIFVAAAVTSGIIKILHSLMKKNQFSGQGP